MTSTVSVADEHAVRSADTMYIGGKWSRARHGGTIDTLNPSTGEFLATIPRATAEDVDLAVEAAAGAATAWQFTDAIERARLLRVLAQLVVEHADELARIESLDSGHYLAKASDLVAALPMWLEYWAGAADKVGGRTIAVPGNKMSFTVLEPLGVTAHIIPWNYPLLILVRSVAPALALGNTCVVKPAEDTSLSALRFAELVHEAGFPDGVFNVVTGLGGEAGAALAAHPDVRGITFTGSTETGREVARLGGQHIAQVNLELGGKSPLIVFPDAPLHDAVEVAVQGFCSRAGQVCVAGSRIFLHDDIADEFLALLAERLESVVLGDPMDSQTNMGPLISSRQYDKVTGMIERAKNEATLFYGGRVPVRENGGFFVEPTVFTDVKDDSELARDEVFGPVTAVSRWSSVDQLVETVNTSEYGLFAVVWCSDITDSLNLAKRLQVGSVMINDWFGELPMTPHGGYKQSGVGREEGLEAVAGYTQVKHIGINLDRSASTTNDWANAPL